MRIEGIALDLEGTIVNNEPAHHWAWVRAALTVGVELGSPERALHLVPHFSGGPDRAIVEEIWAMRPDKKQLADDDFAAFMRLKWRQYDQLIQEIDLSPRPGFLKFFADANTMHIPTTIGTAVELDRAIPLLRRSCLDKMFLLADVILLCDVKNTKPAPDIFLETARRMRVDPRHQVVFEDSPRGVKAGVAAGSVVVGIPVYDDPLVKQRLVDAGAHLVITTWEEIPTFASLFLRLEEALITK